jgi:hypothetical protein
MTIEQTYLDIGIFAYEVLLRISGELDAPAILEKNGISPDDKRDFYAYASGIRSIAYTFILTDRKLSGSLSTEMLEYMERSLAS